MVCILKTYRKCNSTVRFSKYEFNNKLLSDVTLLRVILGVTWTQPIYIYIYMGWVQVIHGVTLSNVTPFNIF